MNSKSPVSEVSIAVPPSSLSPWAACGIADREKRAGDRDRIVHPRALADAPVVDIAAGVARRDRADEIGFRRREPHGAEMQPRRHLHVGQDVFALADAWCDRPRTPG